MESVEGMMEGKKQEGCQKAAEGLRQELRHHISSLSGVEV